MAARQSVRKTASASTVRAWGAEQNRTAGTSFRNVEADAEGRLPHGRLDPALVKAYNAKHKGAQRYAEPKQGGNGALKVVQVTAKPEKGRAVQRTIVESEARAWAREKGLTVGAKGRLPQTIRAAYVLSGS